MEARRKAYVIAEEASKEAWEAWLRAEAYRTALIAWEKAGEAIAVEAREKVREAKP